MSTRDLVTALASSLRRHVHDPLDDAGRARPERRAQDAALDARLGAVEAGIRHLESALEGLQDAVHRRSRLDDSRNDELRRRTETGAGTHDDSGGYVP